MEQTLPKFLNEHPTEVARKLLGCYMVRTFDDGSEAVVRIVETESYDETDEASHTFNSMSPRSATMFGPSGYWYVYFTYGMHFCCNIVSYREGVGAGVLIRAAEPVAGEELLRARRGGKMGSAITNGPAKLCQAMAINLDFNGHNAKREPLRLLQGETVEDAAVVRTTRIGISKAKDELRRFYIADNPYVSVRART